LRAFIASLTFISILFLAGSAGAGIVPLVSIVGFGGCGTATQETFAGDIQATSVSQGVEHQVDDKTGLPAGAKLNRSLVMFKPVDGCSTLLFLAAVAGQPLTVHAFFVNDQDQSVPVELIATNALVVKSQVGTSANGSPQEVVEFGIAGRLTIITRTPSANGSPGPPVASCWDFALNRRC